MAFHVRWLSKSFFRASVSRGLLCALIFQSITLCLSARSSLKHVLKRKVLVVMSGRFSWMAELRHTVCKLFPQQLFTSVVKLLEIGSVNSVRASAFESIGLQRMKLRGSAPEFSRKKTLTVNKSFVPITT